MKCQILFSGKNKINVINVLSAELAQRVVKVNRIKLFMQQSSSRVYLMCVVVRMKNFVVRMFVSLLLMAQECFRRVCLFLAKVCSMLYREPQLRKVTISENQGEPLRTKYLATLQYFVFAWEWLRSDCGIF